MNFIYSEDLFLLEKTTTKLIKTLNQNNEYEVLYFSLIDDNFNTVIETINTFSLFDTKKIVVIKDSYFVNEDKVTLNKNFSIEKLQALINNHNPVNKIIFTLNSEKFSKKLKIAKLMVEKMDVKKIELMDQETILKYIQTFFNKNEREISRNNAELIFSLLPNDMQIISNELNKLVSLNELTPKTIKENITKYLENDIFELSNCFVENKVSDFLKLYKEYLLLNDDLFGLIGLMTSNISFLRDTKILSSQGKTQVTIAELLKAHPYRVKLAFNNKANIYNLNDKIKTLYKIQKGILEGKMEINVLPEYEFVKNMK